MLARDYRRNSISDYSHELMQLYLDILWLFTTVFKAIAYLTKVLQITVSREPYRLFESADLQHFQKAYGLG
jgi:hypothetical protein